MKALETKPRKGTLGLSLVVAVLGMLLMAPTVGDVGGCGTDAQLLDRDRYSAARKREDCDRCRDCGVETQRCVRACDPTIPPEVVLPATCRPLLHDGEVCLRALAAASCDSFASYVDDVAPTSPSECEFCRVTESPSGTFQDAGGGG